MKIKKVDDKPMVIHTKEKAKIHVEDINGELEECYEMMYKEPVQESDIRGLVLDTVSKFYHNIRNGR